MTSWLHEQRFAAVRDAVRASGARTVIDLGCGDGELLVALARDPGIERIVGVELCRDALERLAQRLDAAEPRARVELVHGSMTDDLAPLGAFDCAIMVETIEHLDPERLSVLERSVFGAMRPATVVITTPNADFNPVLGVPASRLRHPGHRFEWGRQRFRRWIEGVARRNGYMVDISDIAASHPALGGASQMAMFRRGGAGAAEAARSGFQR